MLCLERFGEFILIKLPVHIWDLVLLRHSTNGAVDMKLALKASGMGSIPLV